MLPLDDRQARFTASIGLVCPDHNRSRIEHGLRNRTGDQKMKIEQQIERTKTEMTRTKPRSARYAELQSRLKMLVLKQLRSEIRINKRAA